VVSCLYVLLLDCPPSLEEVIPAGNVISGRYHKALIFGKLLKRKRIECCLRTAFLLWVAAEGDMTTSSMRKSQLC